MQTAISGVTFDRTRSAGYLANHLARLFAAALHTRIRPLGLAPAQFMVLLELWAGDGLTQAHLIDRLDVEQATMANTLARMARDGLITRTIDAADRRVQRIWLTDRARALEEPATTAAAAVNQQALQGLDAGERDALLALVGRVIGNLQRGR